MEMPIRTLSGEIKLIDTEKVECVHGMPLRHKCTHCENFGNAARKMMAPADGGRRNNE